LAVGNAWCPLARCTPIEERCLHSWRDIMMNVVSAVRATEPNDMTNSWLRQLMETVGACWEWHALALPIGFEYREPEHKDDCWECASSIPHVAARFGVSEQQVRHIEREGLDNGWPPL